MQGTKLGWALLGIFVLVNHLSAREAPEKFQRFGGIPILAYSEETSLQMGALLLYFFPPAQPNEPASSIDLALYGTLRKQAVGTLAPEFFFNKGQVVWEPKLDIRSWPARYYGLGNATGEQFLRFDSKRFTLESELRTTLPTTVMGQNMAAGWLLDISHNRTKFLPNDTVDLTPPQFLPRNRSGMGIVLQLDSRDHDTWPRSGQLWRARYLGFHQVLGSAGDFGLAEISSALFFPVAGASVMGLEAAWEGSHGEVPFDRLPTPDGVRRLRGIEKGRYRDRHLLSLQSEFRAPLWWRFSYTLFAHAAQVGANGGGVISANPHLGAGAGLRFALNTRRKVNARADAAIVDGKLGLAVYVREAF